MSQALNLWKKLSEKPLGKHLFSYIITRRAPYFATIKPRFELLGPGHCKVFMPKRKAVHNHIGTIHAIALCNLAELVAGVCTDVSVPKGVRWLPKGMMVEYLAKAETDVVGECVIAPIEFVAGERTRDLPVVVEIKDQMGKLVTRATITMYLSAKAY
jgi:acyl-coenzyme A thioesterase PaaI-like protein